MNTENISESNIESLVEIAVQKHQSGEWDEAESLYKQILTLPSELENQYHPIALGNLANIFEKQGKLDAAVEYYQQALKLKPESAEVNYNLGNVLYQQGKLDAAIESYQQALKIKPEIAQAHNNLGNVFLQQGKLDAAIESYQQALKLKPDYAQAHHNLGNVFLQQGKLDAAVESYQQALNIQPNYAAYHKLGNALKLQGKLEAAIKSYQQSISLNPNYVEVHQNLGNTLYEQGKLEAAIESYQQALRLNPDFAPAKFGIVIGQLPIIYSSFEEINIKRNNYQQRLQDLAESYKLTNPKAIEKAVDAVGSLQPFYLAYQGGNDRDLQQIYGETIVQIMSSWYPQRIQPVALPDLGENEKIRVGLVSGFFSNHSNWLIPIKGWVENLDKNKFELYGYYTGLKQDRETAKAAQAFGKFVQGNLSLEQWCEAIAQDKLHILIFPEFGMDPMTIKLGCLRLAAIQITSWGHPNTSGLPTIDYYLSSDLMEPENAQEHYTEKLVRLPNLSIYYTPLAIKPQAIGKKEIGIAEDEIMFWCCQSLFKYLPQHDDVFPQIAKELGKCKFAFIKYDKGEYVTEVFQQRLNLAFQAYGLNYQEYCIFLPRMDAKTFAGVTAIADVFLDSIGWSGCNSTLEAIAHNIPVMTLPGEMMRGRHTMAILKMMGIEETIASSKEEYVKIAVRLGQNPEYRQYISQQIAANQHKLYCDRESVRSLETFLQNIVQKKSAGNLDAAVDSAQKASTIKPDYAEAHYSLGNVFLQQGKFDAAAISYQKALTIKPDFFEVHNDLGNVLFQQSKLDAAAESYQKALTIKPDFAEAHNNLGNVFFQQEKLEAAVESYQKALEIQPYLVDTVYNLGQALAKQLKLEAAVECYRKALEIQPDYVAAKFGICMTQLPIIYASESEVKLRRDNYQQELQKLAKSYQLEIPQNIVEKAGDAVGTIQPFYLAYQGKNDRDLQQTYGETIVNIMAKRYPQWSKPIAITELKANEKVRVGIVSGYFRLHSNWKIPIKGWVENLDRSEFELFGYYTNAKQDRETVKAAKAFDKFIQGPLLLEQWCELIQQDKLHILIFPEFGMNPMTVKLGCLRLAPIQMTSWGHPDTSGLPTIDYYLSSDLMEPENAQEHYTEKLVRLPNLSIHYTPLPVETPAIGKQAIGIAEDEIMFWCCQSLFKYLPQDDDVFPLIAKQLGKCKFVFIESIQSKYITEVFRQRLSRAFEAFGLNYQDRCIFLPRLDSGMFAGATAIADVFLDSIGWSGCNSTLEAIAHNIPVMTLPGNLMRGRHTMAILKMMGISETIAQTKEEYVQIAVRLGQDAAYRQYISQQIAQNKHQLYGDLKPVRALEDFFLSLVDKTSRINRLPSDNILESELQSIIDAAAEKKQLRQWNEAESLYRKVLQIKPDHLVAQVSLAEICQAQNRLEEAIKIYQKVLNFHPNPLIAVVALNNLGNAFKEQGKLEAAVQAYQQALTIQPDAEVYNNLGNIFQQQGQFEAAVECYKQALKIQPDWASAFYNLGNLLNNQSKLDEAVQFYQKALTVKPDYDLAKFGICMSQVPIIYSSFQEMELRRKNYQKHLENLSQSYQIANYNEQAKAADAVGCLKPFYLAYQALNDRSLQQTYGEMICQLMASRYPQWSQLIYLPNVEANEKIRIGFVSGFFRNHSTWKMPLRGWVENLDRTEFELFGYHTGALKDRETARAANGFDKFTQGPLSLEQWCQIITQDKLHVLIFIELMLDMMTVKLGCLRLAPIQMTSWAHYETSGFPTIDYYLSGDLMEGENAQDHYTEKLVKLTNIGLYYKPLAIKPKQIKKQDIGIKDDEIMFWCCQSLFKYLPQHDDVFPQIARELATAKFVFLADLSEQVTEVFRQRLKCAFAEFGLNYQDHCIFLPSNWDSKSFAGSTAIADIFLDSIGCSGGNTSIESIRDNVPVVTCPGELMRERVTMAFLKMMGISETIAGTKEEYVKIAVRLGQDTQYRQHISQQISQKKHLLYGDLKPVRALEDFLLKLVNKPRRFEAREVAETLQLAVQHQRENRYADAEQLYRQVLEKQPEHPEALYGIGMLMQQMGQPETAEQFLVAASQVQPDSVKIWFSLGNLRQAQGQLPEAETAYQRAIALRPDAVTIYNNLGYTLQQQGKLEAAIASYQKALEINPNCAEAEANLGNALHAQGKLSPEQQAHYAELNGKLGQARKKAGDLATAAVYFQKALEFNPNLEEVSTSLREIYQSQQKL